MSRSFRSLLLPRSLKSLGLAIAILATIFAWWSLAYDNWRLRAEVTQLRRATGLLTIRDRTKIHAVEVPTDYPRARKWRVYIPPGRTTYVSTCVERIPKSDLPNSTQRLRLDGPVEATVSVRLEPTSKGGWQCSVRCDLDGYAVFDRIAIPDAASQWIDQYDGPSTTAHVADDVEAPGRPLVLLRKRIFLAGQTPPANEPAETDGLLLWLSD